MQQKKEMWWKVLLHFAGQCKGRPAASVLSAIISAAGSIVPYPGIYHIIKLFFKGFQCPFPTWRHTPFWKD